MASCYIIFSSELDRIYTGICQGDVNDRVSRHNNASYGRYRFTSKVKDWELFIEISCSSISQARKIELHIKRMKSAQYIRNLKKYPEIIRKLHDRYS
ncbi:GIY-YIG nuclease family protein [Membranihabitans maritimus]|uniref:GIY-YIG nuclease family protein n=1 Tax=Membranihabitans maritimus TaxID=2904244 RepID=UPI0034E1FA4C